MIIIDVNSISKTILQEVGMAEYLELEEIIADELSAENLSNIDKTTAIMAALSLKGQKNKNLIFNILEENIY